MFFKTLLIKPRSVAKNDLFADGGRCEPLGLGYLAAVLKIHRRPVEILDADLLGLSVDDVVGEIKRIKPDVVGLSAVTANFLEAVAIAKKAKKLTPSPITVIGGPHITALPSSLKTIPAFDFAVLGEGEETLRELIEEQEKGRPDFLKVKGLALCRQKKLVCTPPRPPLDDLDQLPFPARDLLPHPRNYHPSPGMYRHLPLATIFTSRGCPFNCTFCDRSVFGKIYRARSPKNVVEEMEDLIKTYGVREIKIWDDTFNLDPKRVTAICREILKRGLKFTWSCLGRVNFVEPEMLKMMKKAGCWQIAFGIESGNKNVLKAVNKGLTLAMVKRAVKLTQGAKIEARGFFILGLPGETEKTMQQTIDLALELPLSVADFSILVPFPGTEISAKASEFGKLNRRDLKNYINQVTLRPPFVPYGLTAKQLIRYQHQAYREFFLRPSYLLARFLSIRSLAQLKAYSKALFSFARRFLQ